MSKDYDRINIKFQHKKNAIKMIDKELLEKIEKKLKETGSIRNLNSRDFRFKNWHATTINLLKNLPPNFIPDINDFKKLTFIDTKYHRGSRFFNPADDTKYREDLDSAEKILKKITLAKEEIKPEKAPSIKEKVKVDKTTSSKPGITKGGKTRKPSGTKKAVPVKKGTSAARPKPTRKVKAKKSATMPKKPSAGKTKKTVKKTS